MPAQPDFQRQLESIGELVKKVERAGDPALRATAAELIESVMALHGAALERVLEIVTSAGDAGQGILDRLGRDDLTGSLLVLYGMHPVPFEERIQKGIEKARARLRSRGGDVELVAVVDGDVRVRLSANGHGCGSTPEAFQEIVEENIYQAAPDIGKLTIDGAPTSNGFVPISTLSNGHQLAGAVMSKKGA
jgi:Fe-S cluster biogenesis protein NfuA